MKSSQLTLQERMLLLLLLSLLVIGSVVRYYRYKPVETATDMPSPTKTDHRDD